MAHGRQMEYSCRQCSQHVIRNVLGTMSGNKTFVSFPDPYLSLEDNIREIGGEECALRVTQAFRRVEELIAAEDDATLVEQFGICRPFNVSRHSMDIGMFSEGLIDQISAFIDRYQ